MATPVKRPSGRLWGVGALPGTGNDNEGAEEWHDTEITINKNEWTDPKEDDIGIGCKGAC